ncbi:Acetyl xylan esterase, partial [mine drainage metagenome]
MSPPGGRNLHATEAGGARVSSPARRTLGMVLVGCCLPLVSLAGMPKVVFTPWHADGIYRLGAEAGWTVTVPSGTPDPRGRFVYTIKRNDLDVVKTGSFSLETGKARFGTTLDTPAMLYVVVAYQPSPAAIPRKDLATLDREVNKR